MSLRSETESLRGIGLFVTRRHVVGAADALLAS